MEFTGFTPETIDFLWGIRLNNNRDWFLAHKEDYLETLYHPMLALGDRLREAFREVPGMICKVSRIYRDTRLPRPNGPYKDSLWVSLRPDALYWGEHPCLYFELRPEGGEYGFVLWHPQPAAMERFRQDLTAAPDRFLRLADRAEQETGMVLSGMEYKRKKPCSDPRAARFMSCKNLMCSREIPAGPALFEAGLADAAIRNLTHFLPLYQYVQALE
ncbi:MAG: DUF2461 domain-containing protein [Oscillospiraceae bacterium]|nr:DUF2461 domain-containing protein [Oscillospiraceae bacterium]